MDVKQKKKAVKKKKGKRKRKVGDDRISELAKTELITKIASIEKKIETKLELKASLSEEIQVYDRLYEQELQEKRECAAILETVIVEAEMVNEMFDVNFKRWTKERYQSLQQYEKELNKVKIDCDAFVKQKQVEKEDIKKIWNTLQEFKTTKEKPIAKLKLKEDHVKKMQRKYFEEMCKIDDTFGQELIDIRDNLKWHLRQAAEEQLHEVSSKDSWINDVIEETSRTQLYLQEFDIKAQSMMQDYKVINKRIQSLKAQIQNKDPNLQKMVTIVRTRRDIISSYKDKLKEITIPPDVLPELDSEQQILTTISEELQVKILEMNAQYEDKATKYQVLIKQLESFIANDVHQVFKELLKKIQKARHFITFGLSRAFDDVDQYDRKQQNLILPLLALLDTTDVIDSIDTPPTMSVRKRIQRNEYALGKLGLIKPNI